ncbi:MAG: sugar phosphate nucleotidyltransferase [Nanoarchaeota archaeon]
MTKIRTFPTSEEIENVLSRLPPREVSGFIRDSIIEKIKTEPQVAILCGGLGTRLYPITKEIPKSMVLIKGKPFLLHQVELLKKNGIRDIVLCVGHMADQIKNYFGNGSKFGVRISYGDPKNAKYDMGGVIKAAEKLLMDRFFIMYGDSYLPIDFRKVMDDFLIRKKKGLMVVWKNFDKYDKSNVDIKNGLVTVYDKGATGPTYIDYGLSILDRSVIEQMPHKTKFHLGEVFKALIEKNELAAYEVDQRFYETGSFSGLKDFEEMLA